MDSSSVPGPAVNSPPNAYLSPEDAPSILTQVPEQNIITSPQQPPPTTAPSRSGRRGHRAGVQNYSSADVNSLLDIVEEIEPLGANMWAYVAQDFSKWAIANDRPSRDPSSLKSKFDKMVKFRKPTGNPTCPPAIRRAKTIARSLLAKACATDLGGRLSGAESGSDSDILDLTGNTEQELPTQQDDRYAVPRIGSRTNKRRVAASGTQLGMSPRKKQSVEQSIGRIADTMAEISKTIVADEPDAVKATVRAEVQDALTITNNKLNATNAAVKKMTDEISDIKRMLVEFTKNKDL